MTRISLLDRSRGRAMLTVAGIMLLSVAPAAPSAWARNGNATLSDEQVSASFAQTDSSGLGVRTISAIPTMPAAALVIQAHARVLRPAPLPDQDMDAPGLSSQALAAQEQASLKPGFYSPTQHFAGDGFAAGSTLDSNQINRRHPGGEMSVSIPVQ